MQPPTLKAASLMHRHEMPGQEPRRVPQALDFWLGIKLSQYLSCNCHLYPLAAGVCGDTVTFGCGGRRELLRRERSSGDRSPSPTVCTGRSTASSPESLYMYFLSQTHFSAAARVPAKPHRSAEEASLARGDTVARSCCGISLHCRGQAGAGAPGGCRLACELMSLRKMNFRGGTIHHALYLYLFWFGL